MGRATERRSLALLQRLLLTLVTITGGDSAASQPRRHQTISTTPWTADPKEDWHTPPLLPRLLYDGERSPAWGIRRQRNLIERQCGSRRAGCPALQTTAPAE